MAQRRARAFDISLVSGRCHASPLPTRSHRAATPAGSDLPSPLPALISPRHTPTIASPADGSPLASSREPAGASCTRARPRPSPSPRSDAALRPIPPPLEAGAAPSRVLVGSSQAWTGKQLGRCVPRPSEAMSDEGKHRRAGRCWGQSGYAVVGPAHGRGGILGAQIGQKMTGGPWSLAIRRVVEIELSLRIVNQRRLLILARFTDFPHTTPWGDAKSLKGVFKHPHGPARVNPRTCREVERTPHIFFRKYLTLVKRGRSPRNLRHPRVDQFDTYCENFKPMSCQVIKL